LDIIQETVRPAISTHDFCLPLSSNNCSDGSKFRSCHCLLLSRHSQFQLL